jgi:hypothetical protein
VHSLRTLTVDESGGVHQHIEVNFQNASGVSQTTGIRYRVISTQTTAVSNPVGSAFVRTTQVIVKLVGSGPEDNRTFRVTTHVTVDANGEVAVSFSDMEVACQ